LPDRTLNSLWYKELGDFTPIEIIRIIAAFVAMVILFRTL
jgi:hypothetical protein